MPARAEMEDFAKNILEVIEDALNNRDAGSGELDMIANIAHRIGDIPGFAGLSSFAQHAVMLNAERQSNNAAFDGIQNFWERIKDEIKKEENQKFVMADFAGDVAQNAQQIEQAREEAWDNSTHNFAGMDMSGEEIDNLIDFMKKPSNRAKLIAKIAKKNGGDIDKATKTLDNAILYGELFKKIEKGTATPEEKRKFDVLDKTPGVKEAAQLAHQEQKNTLNQNVEAKAGNTLDSMSTFKDNFSTAPNLREHHAAAIAALTPLDDKPKSKLFAANETVVNPPSNTGLTF